MGALQCCAWRLIVSATLSCTECHRRKAKCDRKVPCELCIKRGVAHKCKWEAKPTKRELATKRRLTDNISPSQPTDIAPLAFEYPLKSEVGIYIDSEPVEITHSLGDFINSVSRNPQLVSLPDSSDADILAKAFSERLPPKEIASQLVKNYFEECNWLPQSLYEPVFHESYDKLWCHFLPPNPLQCLALTFRILSFSLLFLPPDAKALVKTVGRSKLDLMEHYHNISLKAQAASLEREPTTIERIQTLHMHSSWLKNQGKANEAFMTIGDAVKYGQAIGMHREIPGKYSPIETQLRRKVWTIVYTYDRMLSVILSRPYFINDQHCDALPPWNLEWEEVGIITERPLTDVTTSSFAIYEYTLVQLGAKIADACFGPKPPTYATVLQMDQELQKFEATLPPGLHPRIPDNLEAVARVDSKIPTLRYCRAMLSLTINTLRIHLHRAYFLHRNTKKYTFSSYVCLQSALRILDIQRRVRKVCSKTQYRWFWLSFDLLDCSIIVAVAIASEPHGPNAKRLRGELDSALEMLEMIQDYNVTAGPAAKVVRLACTKVDAIISGRKDHSRNSEVVTIPYINTNASINALIGPNEERTHLPSPRASPTILDTTFNFEDFLNSDVVLPTPDSTMWSDFEQPTFDLNAMPAAFDLFAGGEALQDFDAMLAQFLA